ncbi:uncharacterized protein J3R85_003896 [Psidium guajava]|nr:uncharacterized protein J3R85_003896 [Psidium guajava]
MRNGYGGFGRNWRKGQALQGIKQIGLFAWLKIEQVAPELTEFTFSMQKSGESDLESRPESQEGLGKQRAKRKR